MSEWISVEDRLPQKDSSILAVVLAKYNHGLRRKEVCELLYEQNKWLKFYVDGAEYLDEMEEVTHWMPLPEPPCD